MGLREAAYREALKIAHERAQFGKHDHPASPPISEMLSNMKAKAQGARAACCYETARFVEVYKQYAHISHERPLEAEERQEMKYYNRLAGERLHAAAEALLVGVRQPAGLYRRDPDPRRVGFHEGSSPASGSTATPAS